MMKIPLHFSVCVLVITLFATLVQAQSGRRQPQPSSPPPVPTPTPEPTPTPKKQTNDRSEIGFVVSMDRGGGFSTYPFQFYDVVQQSCAERLRSGSSAWVELVRDSMNRAEASKRAKSETTGNVVWLQLSTNNMGRSSSQSYDDIEIEYTVFAPGTGKIVTSGRGFQNARRNVPLGIPKTSSVYREQLLQMAAEDVADRILHALHLDLPAPIPN